MCAFEYIRILLPLGSRVLCTSSELLSSFRKSCTFFRRKVNIFWKESVQLNNDTQPQSAKVELKSNDWLLKNGLTWFDP